MSEAKGQQHEPSMEEILASIRRIIAEDGDAAATPAGAKPAETPPEPPEEVLELTEVVEPDGSVVSLAAAAAERAAAPPNPEPMVQTEEPLRRPELVPPPQPMASEPIVSAATAAASVASLSQIAALSGRGERSGDIPLGAGHLTLETLVREELRPILKDWLDRNLPDMVERLVRAEIARLVHDVQRR
jgi:uncharacterized protein